MTAPDYSIGALVRPGVSKVIEEAGELLELLGKLQATIEGSGEHWTGSLDNRILEEVADLNAALGYYVTQNYTEDALASIAERTRIKRELFETWHDEERARLDAQNGADVALLHALSYRSDATSRAAYDRLAELLHTTTTPNAQEG